jgi:hypothetical protein
MRVSASRVSLVLALAGSCTGCGAIWGPTEVDTNWRTFESQHFTLYVRPGSFAEANHVRLGDVLDDQYVWTQRVLEVTYAGHVSAFLYNNASDGDFSSEHSGVAYADTEAMRATATPPLDGNLYVLLQHEFNHVVQRNTLGRPGTSFVNEGLPSAVQSTTYHSFGKDFYYTWTANHLGAIPPLTDLINDEKWPGDEVAYKASASFLAYLIDRAGAGPIKQLYQTRSADFSAKIQSLYGRSLAELEQDWRAFCVAHG